MLRLSDLLDAVEFGRSVGQRKYGHFDHDGHQMSGPTSSPVAIPSCTRTGGERHRVEFESFRDPHTGEELYRRKKDGK